MSATIGDSVVIRRDGPVGWLIFNRPATGNAMDSAMMAALPHAWRQLDADPEVGCIIVTGEGRAFHTGLDVRALAKEPASLREQARRTRTATLELTGWHLGVRTPVITAVNGVCAGGGLHFVVDSDIVIASTDASFVDPHVSIGQASSWEAIGLMVRIPATIAARLALLGVHERLEAARALECGLVSEVVAPEALRARAQELGEAIAAQPRDIVRATKAALWSALEADRTTAMRMSTMRSATGDPT